MDREDLYADTYYEYYPELTSAPFDAAFGLTYGAPINDHFDRGEDVPSKESMATVYIALNDWAGEGWCIKLCWVMDVIEFRGATVYHVFVDDSFGATGWYTEDRVRQLFYGHDSCDWLVEEAPEAKLATDSAMSMARKVVCDTLTR